MRTIFFLGFILLSLPAYSSCVILLHGLARTEGSMGKLEKHLVESGYQVVNIGYPSRDHAIEVLAEKAIPPAIEQCDIEDEINFVTHSLGGILVRQYLSQHETPNLKYVVMLGPPNKGSEVVDKLGDIPGFHFINGAAGLQLGTGELSVPNRLGPAKFNAGIVAGTSSVNLILSSLIPGVDDGKVSVERTKLAGMRDHIEIAVTHPFMMNNDKVIMQVLHYLENGRFRKKEEMGAKTKSSPY